MQTDINEKNPYYSKLATSLELSLIWILFQLRTDDVKHI